MSSRNLPVWLRKHFYNNKSLHNIAETEFEDLKNNLSRFHHHQPDVSIVIPAYNEEQNIHRTLSSLASNITSFTVEIIVINNNSTDRTQTILDILGIKSFFQPKQGIAYARQLGLEMAKGKYHLCADADTLYPPQWIQLMITPMVESNQIVGVYGRYSFIPQPGQNILMLKVYESLTGILFRLRKGRREHINVLGFNMGFISEIGLRHDGFSVKEVRKFDNALNSADYTDLSEDGNMAVHLLTEGNLEMITNAKARVFTSSRKLVQDGGLGIALRLRLKKHIKNVLITTISSKKKLFANDLKSVVKSKKRDVSS